MATIQTYENIARRGGSILGQLPGYADWFLRLDGIDMTKSDKALLCLLTGKKYEHEAIEALVESARVVHLKWDKGYISELGVLTTSIEHIEDLDWEDQDQNFHVCMDHIQTEQKKLTQAWRNVIADS